MGEFTMKLINIYGPNVDANLLDLILTLKTKVSLSNKEKLVDPTMSNLTNQVS